MRTLRHHWFVLMLATAAGAADSLVPPQDQMSDHEAQLLQARLLARQDTRRADAIAAYERLVRAEPTDIAALTELAGLLVSGGDPAAADAYFRRALASQPRDARLRIGLARICLQTGQLAEAERLVAEAASIQPLDADGLLVRAQMLARLGRATEANAAFDALLATHSTASAELLEAAASARLQAGDTVAARDLLARVLAAEPGRVEAARQYALTLAWTGRDAEARDRLAAALQRAPGDAELILAYAEVVERVAGPDAALAELHRRAAAEPKTPAWLVRLAEIEAGRGHALRARELFGQAFAGGAATREMRLRYGRAAITWGDVATAEAALREALAARPDDAVLRDELGALLLSFDRTAHAEQLYQRWLLDQPGEKRALLGLARVRMKDKDYAAATLRLDSLLRETPRDPDAIALAAAAQLAQGKYSTAAALYGELEGLTGRQVDGLLGRGRVARAEGNEAGALEVFRDAQQLAPNRVDAAFLAAGPTRVRSAEFVDQLTASTAGQPSAAAARLVEWAGLYAEAHEFALAIRCLQAARTADPDYFPAWRALAEFLAIDQRYDAAAAEFRQLKAALPENRQILLGEARALAWSRQYRPALAAYGHLITLNPADPEPIREAARAAGWGKARDEGAAFYARAWREAPVDRALASALPAVFANIDAGSSPVIRRWQEWAAHPVFGDEPFAHMERLAMDRMALRENLPVAAQRRLDEVYVDLLPALRVQRAFFLENQGKQAAWDHRFAHAETALRRLIAVEPGNEEALFDLSQAQAAQGLGERERSTLARLVALDANNSLAVDALRRREIRSRPLASIEVRGWREIGRGDLSRLRREAVGAEVAEPLADQYQLRAGAEIGRDEPTNAPRQYSYRAWSLGAGGVLNPWLSGAASWLHREFYSGRVGHADSGDGQVWLNLRDAARLNAGFARREEITNEHALLQGIFSNNVWLGGSANFTRQLAVDARFTRTLYNDDNRGVAFEVNPAFAWTDHPRIFKTILTLGYRDTDQPNQFLYAGPRLVSLVHPYWSPQNYTHGALTFEWYHDLARQFFAGSQEHVYDLRVSFGTDSESNAGVSFNGEWRREWRDRWLARAGIFLNFSREWDAIGAQLRLSRRL